MIKLLIIFISLHAFGNPETGPAEKMASITKLLEISLRECGSYKKRSDRLLCLRRTKNTHRLKIEEVFASLKSKNELNDQEVESLRKDMTLILENVY